MTVYGTIESIENAIIESSTKYYTTGTSDLSDTEFDYLVSMLRAMDPTNPILTKTGWGYTVNSHDKCKHVNGKIIGIPDKLPPNKAGKITGNLSFIITPKLDGVSVISYYEEGRYVGSLTRGDGEYGENITFHIRDKVPKRLIDCEGKPITGMIRGEFIINKNTWKMKYADQFKSARNFGAGVLNRKEVSPLVKDFDIVHYSLFDCYRDVPYIEQLNILRYNNIQCVEYKELSSISGLQSEEVCKNLLHELNNGIYECDGLVVMALQEDGSYKRYAIKWNENGIPTTVVDMVWEQSRLGKFNPVAIINPVEASGATIKRASAFNYQYVMDNKLGIGSQINIVRSGDVIPYIVNVGSESDDNKCPTHCPNCGTELIQNGVDLICPNKSCSGISRVNRLYFINSVCPVDGMGENILSAVLDYFNINDVIGLLDVCTRYNKHKAEMQFTILRLCKNTKGFGDSTFKKICELFGNMFNQERNVIDIIAGLGLNALGLKNTEKIFSNIHDAESMEAFLNSDLNISLTGVSYVAIDSVRENREYIKKVLSYFPMLKYASIEENEENMLKYDMGIAITGGLSCPRRKFLEKCSKHGIYETTIAKAKVLVTNDPNSGSSKNKTAIKNGIKVMSEEEFVKEYLTNGGLQQG